jgi:hypothetical protein
MPETESIAQREFRTAVKVPIAKFGAVVLLLWLLYGLRLAGIDLLGLMAHNRAPGNPVPEFAYLMTAAAVSFFAIPLLILEIRKNQRLLKNGLRIEARFVSRSMLRKNGVVPVTFAYTVNGVEYTQRRDVAAIKADTYDQGTLIRIIVDPADPRKCMIDPYDVVSP